MGNTRCTRSRRLWTSGNCACFWCGAQLTRHSSVPKGARKWVQFTVEHILPQAFGGNSAPENVRPACRWCNEARAVTWHCIAALACAEAVVGRGDISAIVQWWRQAREYSRRREAIAATVAERWCA